MKADTDPLPKKDGPQWKSDAEALDLIAIYMGAQESWNGGDVCEIVAEIVESTGRPSVGTEDNTAMYRKLADQRDIEHDGDDED